LPKCERELADDPDVWGVLTQMGDKLGLLCRECWRWSLQPGRDLADGGQLKGRGDLQKLRALLRREPF